MKAVSFLLAPKFLLPSVPMTNNRRTTQQQLNVLILCWHTRLISLCLRIRSHFLAFTEKLCEAPKVLSSAWIFPWTQTHIPTHLLHISKWKPKMHLKCKVSKADLVLFQICSSLSKWPPSLPVIRPQLWNHRCLCLLTPNTWPFSKSCLLHCFQRMTFSPPLTPLPMLVSSPFWGQVRHDAPRHHCLSAWRALPAGVPKALSLTWPRAHVKRHRGSSVTTNSSHPPQTHLLCPLIPPQHLSLSHFLIFPYLLSPPS